MRWVALPDAPLDYSAQAEARLLERGVPYLELAHASAGWRDLAGARRRAAGDRRRARDGGAPNGFDVDTGGPTIVRQRYTRWWRSTTPA